MKLVSLKDVKGNVSKMAPSSITKIVEYGNHLIVETKDDGTILIEGEKLILENNIHNCDLP